MLRPISDRPAQCASGTPPHAADPVGFHKRLSYLNRRRLAVAVPHDGWADDIEHEATMRKLEGEWIEAERAEVADWASEAPTNADDFVAWFEALKAEGPGQGDPLFPWLAETARRDEIKWFITQEVAGEAGFDELVALTQLKMPPRAKMELTNNSWDE